MRPHHPLARVISVSILVLLFGSTFLAPLTPTVRAAGLWYVSKSGSNTNDCLSPAAACATINAALNRIAPGDTILVDSGVYTKVGYDSNVVAIQSQVTLSGGWNAAFTAQSGYTTIDGQNAEIGIMISGGSFPVLIQRFLIQNSQTAVFNQDTDLTLDHCVLQNNRAVSGSVGGVYSRTSPALTILDTTIRDNTGLQAGGIHTFGGNPAVVIRGSSITGNSGNVVGAVDISSPSSGTGYIENTTISGNTGEFTGALAGSFEIYSSTITANSSPSGTGAIASLSTVLHNSILAENISPSNPACSISLTSAGYNLFGDLTGCAVALQPGDLSGVDPELGPLQGDPAYHYLLPTSPAVDAANPAGCLDHSGALLDTDQRGSPRVGRCDIGAHELQPIDYSTFSVDPEQAHPGQVLTYTALLRAGGSETLTAVSLSNTLPVGLAYLPGSLQASSGAALYKGGKVTWSGDLDPAAPVTLTYQARATKIGSLQNTLVLTHAAVTAPRSALVAITPWAAYLPAVQKPCPVTYSDSFTDPQSGWYTASTKNFTAQYLPGEYQMLMKSPQYFVISRAPAGPFSNDFQVSVDVRNVTGVDGSYGLMFAASQDWRLFYLFEILPDQTWYVWKYIDPNWQFPANGTSGAIRTGGETNTLTVRHQSNLFEFYINHQFVTSLYDGSYYNANYVGVEVQSFDAAPLDVRFSNIYMPEFSCLIQSQSLSAASTPSPASPAGFIAGPAQRPAR